MDYFLEGSDDSLFLVVVKTDKTRSLDLGRRFRITKNKIRLGNTDDVDIPVGLHWAEKCNVEIFCRNDSWYASEIGSVNHLSINGVSVQKFKISDGDVIQIGDLGFEVSSAQGTKYEFFEDTEKARQEDILTKAYNRKYLESLVEWEISRYKKKIISRRKNKASSMPPMSIAFLDVDHFGDFNKKFGHQVGDEVLKGVVERIKTRIRSTDILVRYGGEEFIIYLPDTNGEQAASVAEEVRIQVADPPFIVDDTKQVSVTISLGVSEFRPDMDFKSFLKEANQKMLLAKKKGRNRVVG